MEAKLTDRICVIGAGPAGLITAHTLLQDGFSNVEVLSRDPSPGGVWCASRVYPGLIINNVHGEYRFSALEMPPPSHGKATGGRLSGEDMQAYMETFANRFLAGKIRYGVEILNVRLTVDANQTSRRLWAVTVEDTKTNLCTVLEYDKVVLCTGGCSEPYIPTYLSTDSAKAANFNGPVVHSSEFRARLDDLLNSGQPSPDHKRASIVVVGGGKSAQDISAYLANQGCRVSIVFTTADPTLAFPFPPPSFLRQSRLFSVLSPHIELRSGAEKFLHTTWLGSKIVHLAFALLAWLSFMALRVPKNSPLRRTRSFFWGVHANDQGVGFRNEFHAMVNKGAIELVAPSRATGFGNDGRSVMLDDGRLLNADTVVVATGYSSSWTKIFDKWTMDEIGLSRHEPGPSAKEYQWNYKSMRNPPSAHPDSDQLASSVYRGLVPAKNILHRDFAINGAVFTTNNGYIYEVAAHWISSYFLDDKFLRLPPTPEEAFQTTERNAAWLRKRHPDILLSVNESYSCDLAFYCWPQVADTMLSDMQLPIRRGGGNALTWIFKVIDLKEIEHLRKERANMRMHTED